MKEIYNLIDFLEKVFLFCGLIKIKKYIYIFYISQYFLMEGSFELQREVFLMEYIFF